jgi:hypothetical protein
METQLTCKKLVVVRSGHEEWATDYGPRITDKGWGQMMNAAKRLGRLLGKNTSALFVQDDGTRKVEFAQELGAMLQARVLEKDWPKWINTALRNKDGGSLNSYAKNLGVHVLIQVTEQDGLRQFRYDMLRHGFRNLSAKVEDLPVANDAYTFGHGAFWCADLEKRTLFCGRASCNSGEVTRIYPDCSTF